MNTNELTTAVTDSINGVKLLDIFPHTGNGWWEEDRGDIFGGAIGRVAKDGSWFQCISDDGKYITYAKFDYRKNSRFCGYYMPAGDIWQSPGKLATSDEMTAMTDKQILKLLKLPPWEEIYGHHICHIAKYPCHNKKTEVSYY